MTDGQSESSTQVFSIQILGQNSGEIHFHSSPIEVREGKCSNILQKIEFNASEKKNSFNGALSAYYHKALYSI